MNGTMWEQTNFVLGSQSWEIGSPPTDGQDAMWLSFVIPVLVIILSWHSFILVGDRPPQCKHWQWVIFLWGPHLQPVRDNVFRNESVMESFRFHPQLIIKFLRETVFYQKFIFHFLLEVFYWWFYLSYTTCDFTTVACPFGMHFCALLTWCNLKL